MQKPSSNRLLRNKSISFEYILQLVSFKFVQQVKSLYVPNILHKSTRLNLTPDSSLHLLQFFCHMYQFCYVLSTDKPKNTVSLYQIPKRYQ